MSQITEIIESKYDTLIGKDKNIKQLCLDKQANYIFKTKYGFEVAIIIDYMDSQCILKIRYKNGSYITVSDNKPFEQEQEKFLQSSFKQNKAGFFKRNKLIGNEEIYIKFFINYIEKNLDKILEKDLFIDYLASVRNSNL